MWPNRRKLRIWSHLLKKSLMENFNFCAVSLKPHLPHTVRIATKQKPIILKRYWQYFSLKRMSQKLPLIMGPIYNLGIRVRIRRWYRWIFSCLILIYAYSCFNISFINISAIKNTLNRCHTILNISVTQKLIFTQAFN